MTGNTGIIAPRNNFCVPLRWCIIFGMFLAILQVFGYILTYCSHCFTNGSAITSTTTWFPCIHALSEGGVLILAPRNNFCVKLRTIHVMHPLTYFSNSASGLLLIRTTFRHWHAYLRTSTTATSIFRCNYTLITSNTVVIAPRNNFCVLLSWCIILRCFRQDSACNLSV